MMPELPSIGTLPTRKTLQLGRAGAASASGPSEALGAIGRELEAFGQRHYEYHERVRRANFIGTRFASLSEAAMRIETEARRKAAADGGGYVDYVSQAFEEELSKAYVGAPDAASRTELENRARVLKTEVTRRAIADADRMMRDHTVRQVEDAAEKYSAAVISAPEMLAGAVAELDSQIDAAGAILTEDETAELRKKAAATVVGSAVQSLVTADRLNDAESLMANPQYAEGLTTKQILAFTQQIVQRRQYLRDKAEAEARQRRIEARQAAQERAAIYAVGLAAKDGVDDTAAVQAIVGAFGGDPSSLSAAMSAFNATRSAQTAAAERRDQEGIERVHEAIAAGVPPTEAIQNEPWLRESTRARLFNSIKSDGPSFARVTNPELAAVLAMGESGHPGFLDIVQAIGSGEYDYTNRPGGSLHTIRELPKMDDWLGQMTEADFKSLRKLITDVRVGKWQPNALGGLSVSDVDNTARRALLNSGITDDDPDWLPTYTAMRTALMDYARSFNTGLTLDKLDAYAHSQTLRVMKPDERPSVLQRWGLGSPPGSPGYDMPPDQDPTSSVYRPVRDLTDIEIAGIAMVVSRESGVHVSPTGLRDLMQTMEAQGLPLTRQNIKDALRVIRHGTR